MVEQICRTCFKVLDHQHFLFLWNHSGIPEFTSVKEVLRSLVPEINLDVIADPIICDSCWHAVQSAYKFRKSCLDNEKIISQFVGNALNEKHFELKDVIERESTLNARVLVNDGLTNAIKLDHEYTTISVNDQGLTCDGSKYDRPIEVANTNCVTETANVPLTANVAGILYRILVKEDPKTAANEAKAETRSIFSKNQKHSRGLDCDSVKNVCQQCGKTFRHKRNLTCHMRVHNGLRINQCTLCGKQFQYRHSLNLHMATSHGNGENKIFSCTRCDERFEDKAALIVHRKTHKVKKSFTCEVCSKSLSDRSAWRKHQFTHSTEKLCICELCGKRIKNAMNLRGHILRVHTKQRKFQCHVCSKKFFGKTSWRNHELIHTGLKPFKCEICLRCFGSARSQQRHMSIHTGEKPFSCSHCGKKFSQSYDAKQHESRRVCDHGVSRQPCLNRETCCKICNKTFSHYSYMPLHMRSHSGEKPEKCELCDRNFSRSATLKRHMMTHTGEKPYSCEICGEQFRQSNHVKKHVKRHMKQ